MKRVKNYPKNCSNPRRQEHHKTLARPQGLAHQRTDLSLMASTLLGVAGLFAAILGMMLLGDSTAPLRILRIVFILAGVIGLKLVS
ncbi:hypothetical protein EV677_0407 [Herminiimonas fonticola]|uniref:Uncharacterized protein n=1 Tax=Herminiimonas fonticola TaxID=303380 RepID=A0A4R6GG73_9BURK|nr:hypothetical protein Hfont_0391 [Herminiimonas fonticola]TDN93872.1 hypothetical protein EV677_0407 [Herminiimonas fonticola]